MNLNFKIMSIFDFGFYTPNILYFYEKQLQKCILKKKYYNIILTKCHYFVLFTVVSLPD